MKKMAKKVMIVDDDPSVLITVRAVLEDRGFEVYAVSSGEDCIEEMKTGFKGVILMDIMMPRMDGWETIEEIVKSGFSEGNVIAIITAKDLPEVKMNVLNKHVAEYIIKPFQPYELVSTVEKCFTHLQ